MLLAFLVASATSPDAMAQQPHFAQNSPERFAFDIADVDGDGRISEAEMTRDAAAGFAGLDRDGSMTLTPEELGPHDPARFSRVDANGDGVLSFSEVMRHKLGALERGDKDEDGGLSFDEMVDIVRADEEGAG
jgi:Ca2+-binding EF-hand superfamily protein